MVSLTRTEKRLFDLLWLRRGSPVDYLTAQQWLYTPTTRPHSAPIVIRIMVCRLRKKLANLGVTIVNRRGWGWVLECDAAVQDQITVEDKRSTRLRETPALEQDAA